MSLRAKRSNLLNKNGFTLLELIIVLTLVTLILGLSTVFFAGYLPSAKVDATAREISGMIRHARSLARMNRESRTVLIDLDARTYGIVGLGTKSFPPEALVRIIDPVAGEIDRGQYPIVFRPSGGMSGGTIIVSQGKKTIRIELDPITGASRIMGNFGG